MRAARWAEYERKSTALDVGRGLAILSVIYGHALAPWFMGAGEQFSQAGFLQWKFGASFMMTFFFFLPSILLSGFMFPFRGMPEWAQFVGDLLPLTHFLRLIRGVMLKGNELHELWPNLWPLAAFTLVVMSIGLKRFRRTLD